ncbi:MAG: crcB [Gemmataceae bacterium]|nr:crcB [Gemmataceae bacterium]
MPDWLTSFLTHPVTLLTVGGGAGTNARYWFGRLVAEVQKARLPDLEFPWGTFLINVSGSVLFGVVAAAYLGHPDPARRSWYLLLGTGFCGGYTTFSTFSFETFELFHDGKPLAALAYALGSVAVGVVGVWLAMRAVGK